MDLHVHMISFILVYWIGNVTCVMAAQISIAIKLDLNTCTYAIQICGSSGHTHTMDSLHRENTINESHGMLYFNIHVHVKA